MKRRARVTAVALCATLLHVPAARAAQDKIEVRAFVNSACIVADEPYFLPASAGAGDAKFLPLLGIVVGKLAELFINHELQASAARLRSGAARKDTHFAVHTQMNLYKATFDPAPALALNAQLGCMTIVAGTFEPEPAQCSTRYLPKALSPDSIERPPREWQTTRTDASIENQLRRGDVCVIGKVHAVYEARFEFSGDGTAYRLTDAGYRLQTLLTTTDANARRNTVYALKITDPAVSDPPELLSSAWVDLGPLAAGSESAGGKGKASPWLRVPPLSTEARRAYDARTKLQQEVSGEIEALRRALVRQQRLLAGLDRRIAEATPQVAEGLRQERDRIEVVHQSQGAELEARLAEYQDLPRGALEFMPVTAEVSVTETDSEKSAQLALADILGKTGSSVATAVGSATAGLMSKAVDARDLDTGQAAVGLREAQDGYFDVLIEAKAGGVAATPDSRRKLEAAKQRYNVERRSAGLEPIT